MKQNRFNNSLSLMVVFVMLISTPSVVFADPVTWSAQTFRAYAYSSVSEFVAPGEYIIYDEHSHESFGPPLTINASASASWPLFNPKVGSSASSAIGSVDMQVHTGANACCELSGYAYSSASFTGRYISDIPYFQFTYAYSGDIDQSIDRAWLSVYDLTGGVSLFDADLSSGSSDTISIATPSGHNIKVFFGLETESILYAGLRTNTLSYSTAVLPEPISSTLFIVGGATLGFRRFWKGRKSL